MNERQREIIRILLNVLDGYLSINQIAKQLQVSEKTIRTDFKKIDRWLEEVGSAKIERKPSLGVRISMHAEDKSEIFSRLNSISQSDNSTSEWSDWVDIIRYLLITKRDWTIQDIANKFFLTKVALKKELENATVFLEKHNLKLEVKQRIGISITGKEKNKRAALVKITESLLENASHESVVEQWIPLYEMDKIKSALTNVEKEMGFKLTEQSFDQVVLHIFIAIKRIKSRLPIELTEIVLEECRMTKEYTIAELMLNGLRDFYSIRFPEEEIAYISIHLQGAKYDVSVNGDGESLGELLIKQDVVDFTKKLIERISRTTRAPFALDIDLYEQLSLHLHTSIYRMKQGLSLSNPILNDIQKMYPYMFEVVLSTLSTDKGLHPYASELPLDEVGYITIHFQASLERLERKTGNNKRVLIVCSYGVGIASLLRTKIERKFHSIEIVGSVSSSRVLDYSNKEVDVIITTIPLQHDSIPIIEVSPLFTQDEYENVKNFIETAPLKLGEGRFPILKKKVKKELIEISISNSHRFEVIEEMANRLYKEGFVNKQFIESALKRERQSPTAVGGGIAIPHGDPAFIIEPRISIGIMKNEIEWGTERVKLVILIAGRLTEGEEVKQLFHEISHLSEDPQYVDKIISCTSSEEVYQLL